MAVRIAAQFQPQHVDYAHMRDAWREADRLGADVIYTWDHFFPLYGDPDGQHYECIAMLGSMAEVTERAEIGALVVCNAYRNPELLAHAHQTVDHASGGRVVLGIGSGWFQRDFDEYGYQFGTKGSRLDALAEALPRIERRLERLHPPPARRMPILIGGGGVRKTLRLVARHADRWHANGDIDVFREKDAVLRRHCEAEGRDHTEIMRSWGTRDRDPGLREALTEAGVREHVVSMSGDGRRYDLSPLEDALRWRDAIS